MELSVKHNLCFFFLIAIFVCGDRALAQNRASHPPRGWNSYDSFIWTISEQEFLQSAEVVAQRLKPHGYQYVVVDYLWYRKKVEKAGPDSHGFDVIDKWGRPIPDPGRWPSSSGGRGFTEVAKKVHDMGLSFGIHVMRGLSVQAYEANTPILDITTGRAYEEAGRQWRAQDIGLKQRACPWMPNGFMSVNTELGAGRAFLRSLYQQYADWEVDFVKHDCVFGEDLDIKEITFVSKVLRGLKRPILYSLSPGVSVTPAMAKQVIGLVNMYRITGDDWDSWGDVTAHFNVSRDFAASNMIGAEGLQGKSWPDLDMLPLGWLTDQGSNEGPHRTCRLTLDEQRTQMTLWSMAKSPLMFGGDVRRLDDMTYKLITEPTLLEINSFSSNNMEFHSITGSEYPKEQESSCNKRRRYHSKDSTSDAYAMDLTSCKDERAAGWLTEAHDQDAEQVCWKQKIDVKIKHGQKFSGKLQLAATDRMEFCLNASPIRRLTSKEIKRGSFSPCRWDDNQMWQLHQNGTIMSGYSGQCVVVKSAKAAVELRGIRSWIATGRRGEIYVAFFNLNPGKKVISANISDVHRALGRQYFKEPSCKGREVWSGKDLGLIKQKISMPVPSHGSALFVLTCD